MPDTLEDDSGSRSLLSWLQLQGRGIITLVGAGGKTTLMYRLAKELVAAGKRVVTTTTTRIAWPGPDQSPVVLASDSLDRLAAHLTRAVKRAGHVTIGCSTEISGAKLGGFSPFQIDLLLEAESLDWILVEGDGAARKPVKAPAVYEPVIPSRTMLVIGVIGLTCLGLRLDEANVHRAELLSRLSRLQIGRSIDPECLVRLICHDQGLFKGLPAGAQGALFLNQAEERCYMYGGRTVVDKLADLSGHRVMTAAVGCANKGLPVIFRQGFDFSKTKPGR